MCGDNRDVLDEFIERVEATLSESTIEKSIEKIDREVTAIGHKKKNLLDMRLEDKVDQITYDIKMEELSEKEKKLLMERQDYLVKQEDEKNLKRRTKEFKKLLEKNQVLEEFDRGVFESIIEKVIVGETDENGNKDPYKLTFVYKTGISNKVDPKIQRDTKLGQSLKAELKKMCSHVADEVKEVCSQVRLDTRRVSNNDAACGKMKNLALKTTTSLWLKSNKFDLGENWRKIQPIFALFFCPIL